MNICQLTRNPTTGRIEADGYAFHSHDNICVMIPDCNITMRLWEDPRLHFDLEKKRWYLEDAFDPYQDIWNGFWTHTRLCYSEELDRWYLEDYPIFRVEGMFAQL